jgi:hypothetical protein
MCNNIRKKFIFPPLKQLEINNPLIITIEGLLSQVIFDTALAARVMKVTGSGSGASELR